MVLIGVAIIIGGLVVLFYSGDDPSSTANAASDDQSKTDGTPDTAGAAQTPSTRNGADTSGNTSNERQPIPGPEALARINEQDPQPSGQAQDQYEQGVDRLDEGDYVTGRKLLSELLFRDGALSRRDAHVVRERLANLSAQCVFQVNKKYPVVVDGIEQDPIRTYHKVQPGENLTSIANLYRTPYELIMRINGITDPRKLRADQKLQILKGPVHARVDKSDYRMDLYVVDPDGLPIYLKSYPVGLGESDSTPIGKWKLTKGGKVGPANGGPSWRNPRTEKFYENTDPDIPIGEYWIGLEGTDDNTKDKQSYGIHATTDPNSIGQQESMGCIRMRDADVDEVFYTLYEVVSTVEIVK